MCRRLLLPHQSGSRSTDRWTSPSNPTAAHGQGSGGKLGNGRLYCSSQKIFLAQIDLIIFSLHSRTCLDGLVFSGWDGGAWPHLRCWRDADAGLVVKDRDQAWPRHLSLNPKQLLGLLSPHGKPGSMKLIADLQHVGIDVSKLRLDVHIHPPGEVLSVDNCRASLGKLAVKLKRFRIAAIGSMATGGFFIQPACLRASRLLKKSPTDGEGGEKREQIRIGRRTKQNQICNFVCTK